MKNRLAAVNVVPVSTLPVFFQHQVSHYAVYALDFQGEIDHHDDHGHH
jgi:hypothetical protein